MGGTFNVQPGCDTIVGTIKIRKNVLLALDFQVTKMHDCLPRAASEKFVQLCAVCHSNKPQATRAPLKPILSSGRAKRAPHWGVQSRFRVIYVYIIAWSAVVLGINSTSNAGSNFHEAKPSEIS